MVKFSFAFAFNELLVTHFSSFTPFDERHRIRSNEHASTNLKIE